MVKPEKKSLLPITEAYYKSLIEDALDIITVMDRAGNIQYASPANRRVLGYEPEELIGVNGFTLVHPEDRLQALKIWGTGLLHPNVPHWVQFRYRHKDGSWRLMESIGKYVKDDSGPHRVVINSRDVTDRHQALRLLHEMEDMYRQMLDAFSDMVFVKTPGSRMHWANKSFRDYYGMTNEQLKGIIDAPFNEPDYTQQYIKDDEHVFKTGQTLDIPSEPATRYDGSVRHFHTVKSPILDTKGKVAMIVGVSRDITERGKLEAIVRQTEKMSAVGQLAAGVAHELNNPLTVVLGFAQAMLVQMEKNDAFLGAVQSIERETLRCKNLVQNLLTFSRERKPEMISEAPLEIIENALSLVETQARIKKIEVRRVFEENLPSICADRNQIQEVVINLCTNAMDAMPVGGFVTVAMARRGQHLEIRVTDTGTGIPENIRARIFEPFFTTKEVGKGTGLGLSLVYEIVQKHQGRIDFETERGEGTTFIVQLPVADVASSSPSTKKQAA